MALQFQPPQGAKTKRQQQDENFDQLASGAMGLASQWSNYKKQRLTEEIELKKLRSQYGTGAPPPLGPVAESKEEELARLGTEAYGKLNPQQYVAAGIGPDGKPTFTNYPVGTKPGPAAPSPTTVMDAEGNVVTTTTGKPTVLPKPNAIEAKAEGEMAEAQSIADNAIAELNRIRPLNDKSRGGVLGRMAQRVESMSDPDKPSEQFTNTADVINSLKGMVVSVLKSTFGGQLSDGEREYLNEVYGAVEGMSRAERKIAIDGVERTLRGAQKRAASKAAAVGGGQVASVPSVGQSIPAADDNIVDTQEEYDALPSGAVYIDSNGKKARKR